MKIMTRSIEFDGHTHRCLFRNDCVQAHLLALTGERRSYEAIFSGNATLIVTYGTACACFGNCVRQLQEGDQVEVPRACPLRISADDAADVMLLVR